jgi:RimJ/RimL family protein N-acetyltransferase
MILRKATMEDCDFIFNLRNEPYVRKASWNTEKIEYSKHKEWFKNNYKFYYIIGDRKGFVRIKDKEVSIAVVKEEQNTGLGTAALNEIAKIYPYLKAEVKLDNEQSINFFKNAGFKPVGYILEKISKKENNK